MFNRQMTVVFHEMLVTSKVILIAVSRSQNMTNIDKSTSLYIFLQTVCTKGAYISVHLKRIPKLSKPRGFEIVGLFPTGCFGI